MIKPALVAAAAATTTTKTTTTTTGLAAVYIHDRVSSNC